MSEFDPYLKWLGIRESTRPVNHYRLLGVELFESDKDVISMSADRQMAHIRTYQSGPNGPASQRILNELARARRCLLVEEKKAAYDKELRAQLNTVSASSPPIVATEVSSAPPIVQPTIVSSATPVVEPTIVESGMGGLQGSGQVTAGAKLNLQSDPNARQKTKNREKKQLVWSLFGWVTGGLAALGVGAFLLGSGILGPDKPTQPVPEKKPVVVPGKNDSIAVEPKSNLKTNGQDSNSNLGKQKIASKGGNDIGANSKVKPGSATQKTENSESTNGSSIAADSSAVPNSEMPVVWSVKNIGNYPQPSSVARALLSRVNSDVNAKRLQKLGGSADSTAGTAGVKQEIMGLERPSLLIGMTYTVGSDLKIVTLNPVLIGQDRIVSSGSADSRVVVAKPGYAVGEVQGSILSPMNCFRVHFMKVTPTGLDPRDSYFSSWIGREVGPVRTIANPLNAPIVALYCDTSSNGEIRTLGLVGAHRSMRPTEILPEIAAGKPIQKTKATSDIVGNSLPVLSRNPIPSSFFTSGAPKELVVFVNELDEAVEVCGVDAKMKLQRKFQLSPGSTRSYPSLLGAYWHVKKGSLGIATYKAGRGQNTAVIDNRKPDISSGPELPDVEGLDKAPIPSSSDRSTAMKEVKKVYGDMISRANLRSARENRGKAESLIDDARDSGDDLARQYTMFETAKEVALLKGDCETAMVAVRELDRRFDGFEFWDEAASAVEDSGRSLARTGDKFMAQELQSVLRGLIDEAIQSGQSRSAGKLVSYGMKAASRNGDADAVRFYKSKDNEVDEVAKLLKQYENAVVKLAADPKNSNANIQKGRYLIVAKRDFENAIACWKLSDDETLLAIVKDESTPDANASFLARRWQNLGKDTNSLFGRRCFERAIEVLEAAGKRREAGDLQKLLRE